MKVFKRAPLIGLILFSIEVMMGVTWADSYLAPLVISNDTTQTYFAFKMRGAGVADEFSVTGRSNPNTSHLHYYHLQKWNNTGTAPVSTVLPTNALIDNSLWSNPEGGCKITNTTGNGSSWDVILQGFRQSSVAGTAADFIVKNNSSVAGDDASQPAGWISNMGAPIAGYHPFIGMTIIDDIGNANIEPSNGRRINEGEMSGFVFIVSLDTGFVLDYKLFNNPYTKRSGDFKTNWIAKTSIDWMWLPANRVNNTVTSERTAWYTAVVGEGMSTLAEQQGVWNESVRFTQALEYDDVMDIRFLYNKNSVDAPGAYNNDEQVLSGPKNLKVTCLGFYDRSKFLTLQQYQHTSNGGWKRSHIVPINASGVDSVKAHGAITFRTDMLNTNNLGIKSLVNGLPIPMAINPTLTVETSGHLSASKNKQHPNRGF